MTKIVLSQVHEFLRHGLKGKLRNDLRKVRILKEADLECCTYFHLRTFLKSDEDWHVFARKYSSRTGYYSDIVVYKKKKQQLAIEIKWRWDELSRKDRRSLQSVRKYLGIRKTYFISALPDKADYAKGAKRRSEKYRLFEVIVDLGYKDRNKEQKIEAFERERREFRK